jgi:hypothetical protein
MIRSNVAVLRWLKAAPALGAAALMVVLPVHAANAWGRHPGGVHPSYGGRWARPSPVVIHKTYVTRSYVRGGGCVGCGIGAAAVAGLVGGAILGAAIAGSAAPPAPVVVQQPPTVVYQQPPTVVYQQPQVVQAPPPPDAYQAPPAVPPDYVPPQPPAPAPSQPGVEVSTLPAGCQSTNINEVTYYICGSTWYQPYFGGNGAYYVVVPPQAG